MVVVMLLPSIVFLVPVVASPDSEGHVAGLGRAECDGSGRIVVRVVAVVVIVL